MKSTRNPILFALVPLMLACGVMSAPLALTAPTAPAAVNTSKPIDTITPTVTHYCLGIVTADALNLRASADYRSPADGAGLVKGQAVEILGTVGDWFFVSISDGRTGYARAGYIYTNGC